MKKLLAVVVLAGSLGMTVGCAEEAKKPAGAPGKGAVVDPNVGKDVPTGPAKGPGAPSK